MELTLNQKLSLIQKEFKANKSKFNSFGKYNFRSAEDILEALKPYNEKYGVSFIISEEFISTFTHPIIKSTATIYDNNGINELSATAIVGVDMDMKGTQTPQKYGSASSYAKKYALGNLLLIDDTQDSDASNKHDKTETVKQVNIEETKVEEKTWLNKNTPDFKRAVEFIKKGGKISAIEERHKLSKEVRDELSK